MYIKLLKLVLILLYFIAKNEGTFQYYESSDALRTTFGNNVLELVSIENQMSTDGSFQVVPKPFLMANPLCKLQLYKMAAMYNKAPIYQSKLN